MMIKEHRNISLRKMNTFGIEAQCERLVEFRGEADLHHFFAEQRGDELRWSVLGGGSNILFAQDFEGTLLHPVGREVTTVSDDGELVVVRAEAGVVWDDFVEWCVERELWGVENLSYIPGYVGAAPVQNIGAYGVEAKDVIRSVEMFNVEGLNVLNLANEYCKFEYRDSVFKHSLRGKVVIMAVNFNLRRTPSPNMGYGDLRDRVGELGEATLRNIRDAVVEIRRAKLPEPEEFGNAGSFFKNPIITTTQANELKKEYPSMPLYPTAVDGYSKLASGWLIDQCGWKGRRVGRVGVHAQQALVLINLGGATGREVLELAEQIKADVADRFGVDIEMEVNIL